MGNFFGFQGEEKKESNISKDTEKIKNIFSSALKQMGQVVQDVKNVLLDPKSLPTHSLLEEGKKSLEKENWQKAKTFFLEGATRYDLDCMFQLQQMYQQGIGVEADDSQSWFWARMCAEAGSGTGDYLTGYAYLTGKGVEKNKQKAFAYFERACRRGNAEAKRYLDELVKEHIVILSLEAGESESQLQQAFVSLPFDDKEDFERSLKLAGIKNNALGKRCAGHRYLEGRGVEKDVIAAYYWLKKASELDDVYAYSYLAKMYATGTGVLLDYYEAIRLYDVAVNLGRLAPNKTTEIAAEQAEILKERLAMSISEINSRIDNNKKRTLTGNVSSEVQTHFLQLGWLRNDIFSCGELASLHLFGSGVPFDANEALFFAGKAILGMKNSTCQVQGIDFVYYLLSYMYAWGIGIKKNTKTAEYYFQQAALTGQEYRGYSSVYDYMEVNNTAQINKGLYFKGLSYELPMFSNGIDYKQALEIYKADAENNFLPSIYKVMWFYIRHYGSELTDTMFYAYWEKANRLVMQTEGTPNLEYHISEISGMILTQYNAMKHFVYESLTGPMILEIAKRLSNTGNPEFAKICFDIANKRDEKTHLSDRITHTDYVHKNVNVAQTSIPPQNLEDEDEDEEECLQQEYLDDDDDDEDDDEDELKYWYDGPGNEYYSYETGQVEDPSYFEEHPNEYRG